MVGGLLCKQYVEFVVFVRPKTVKYAVTHRFDAALVRSFSL